MYNTQVEDFRLRIFILTAVLCVAPSAFAAEGIGKVFDDQISSIEREVLGLAQKMPADKYDFAPTSPGTFTGVRTYALQVRHIATELFHIAEALTGEKSPVNVGTGDNGPDTLKTKDQIIDYFKSAIAFARKGVATITDKNMNESVPMGRNATRASAAAFIGLHTYDHYGQMVVYARMNGVTPGGGPPPGAAKGKGK